MSWGAAWGRIQTFHMQVTLKRLANSISKAFTPSSGKPDRQGSSSWRGDKTKLVLISIQHHHREVFHTLYAATLEMHRFTHITYLFLLSQYTGSQVKVRSYTWKGGGARRLKTSRPRNSASTAKQLSSMSLSVMKKNKLLSLHQSRTHNHDFKIDGRNHQLPKPVPSQLLSYTGWKISKFIQNSSNIASRKKKIKFAVRNTISWWN